MNNNQLMINSKQTKLLSSLPKTKLLKEQILAFQSALNSPFDKKYTKISDQNKKKTGIHKIKTIGIFDEKQQSLTDSSKDTNKFMKSYKERVKKLRINGPQDQSAGKDMSLCSSSIQTEDKNKEEREIDVINSKQMSEKHDLNTKYSLKKLMPELKSHLSGLRDSSVKEKRPLINMFPGKIPMNNLLMYDKSVNSSAWNSNNNNSHSNSNVNAYLNINKFQVVKKEKTLTLLKIKENKMVKEARDRDKEREKEKEKAKDNGHESKDNDDCFSYEAEKPCELTEDEKVIYGNREMRQYKKQSLLGK